MLKIFICPECYNIRMVSKRPNAVCLHCNKPLVECDLEYGDYTRLSAKERDVYKDIWRQKNKKRKVTAQKSLVV